MNIKSISIVLVTAAVPLSGANTFAAPTPRIAADLQQDIKILSAKIENAIADLGENRSEDDIKSVAIFVMDTEGSNVEIKTAALNMVIQNAILLQDGLVVGALKSIEFEVFDLLQEPEIRTDDDETTVLDTVNTLDSKSVFLPPPALSYTGGSDY